jgi:GNAT superfamily N-acetyltransferase
MTRLRPPVDTRGSELSRYSFRRLALVELPLLNDLYNTCYGTARPIETAEWLYKANPGGEGIVLGAFDARDELVGARPAIAWKFLWRGQERLGYQFTDAVVAPAHRGRGIFSRLVHMLLELAEEGGFSLFSFPNDQSLPIYLKTGSLEYLGRCDAQVKILAWQRYLRYKLGLGAADGNGTSPAGDGAARLDDGDTSLIPIGRFESDFEDIHADLGRLVTSFTLRSKEFLNWRYFGCPERRYRAALLWQAGRAQGYLVIRTIGPVAHVIDVFLRPDVRVAEKAPRLAARWARQMGAIALHFEGLRGHVFRQAFRDAGFLLRRHTGQVVMDSVSVRQLASLRGRPSEMADFYFVMGDSDGK